MHQQMFLSFLDSISRCFLEKDFELWRQQVILPLSLITRTGPIVLETVADLKANFDLYTQSIDPLHLDEIVRLPLGLEDCRDGTWIGTYETNLLSKGTRATEPYRSSALLVERGGRFRALSVMNARGPLEWTTIRQPSGN